MTKSIYELFETDAELEQKGIVLDYGDHGKFRIARAGGANTRFAKILEAKIRPYRRQIDNGTVDEEVGKRLMIEAFVEGVLMGWDGVTDRKGKEIPFTRENAVKLFMDLAGLFSDIQAQAMDMSNFLMGEIEEDAKN